MFLLLFKSHTSPVEETSLSKALNFSISSNILDSKSNIWLKSLVSDRQTQPKILQIYFFHTLKLEKGHLTLNNVRK